MGLMAAIVEALTGDTAVLYAAYDIESRGPLATMACSRGLLGAALVLAPQRSARTVARLAWRLEAGEVRPTPAAAANAALVEGNAMAGCLALLEALAEPSHREVALTLSGKLILRLETAPHG
jgi:hypothetical protein